MPLAFPRGVPACGRHDLEPNRPRLRQRHPVLRAVLGDVPDSADGSTGVMTTPSPGSLGRRDDKRHPPGRNFSASGGRRFSSRRPPAVAYQPIE
jgi:hypothetical protein